MNETSLRSRAVEVATSLVGLSVKDDPFERWARLLNLAPPAEVDVAGFLIMGIWKSLGVSHRNLDVPHDGGQAVFQLTHVAMDCGAWRCRPKSYLPLPGDVAVLSDGSPEGAHAYIVTQVRPGHPSMIRSVEGGPEGVLSRIHSWEGAIDTASGRSVLGWIDVTSLPIPSNFAN